MSEMILIYDGLEEVAKENGMTVEQLKEYQKQAAEKDPVQAKLKMYRYHLQATWDGFCDFWDSLEKKHIEIRGEKRCEKWQKEHAGEWCTDF